MAKRLNWERCKWTWRKSYDFEPPPPDDLEARATAEVEVWKKTNAGVKFAQNATRPETTAWRATGKKKQRHKRNLKSALMPRGKRMGSFIKQLANDLAKLDEQAEHCRRLIDALPSGPRKVRLQAQLENALEGDAPEPRAPRATWDSTQWFIEAEYQKGAARKYRHAGYADKARKCEATARKALVEGQRLRAEGR